MPKPRHAAPVRTFKSVAAADIVKLGGKNGTFISVDDAAEFDSISPAGFVNIPYYKFEASLEQIPKSLPVYLIDSFGYYSGEAGKILDSKGYSNVNVVDGGMPFWIKGGGKLVSNDKKMSESITLNSLPQKPTLAMMEEAAARHGIVHDPITKEDLRPVYDAYFEGDPEYEKLLAEGVARANKKSA